MSPRSSGDRDGRGRDGDEDQERDAIRLLLCAVLCETSHMATNLDIDPGLLERALEVSGERTKTAAVTRALEEYIARREQRRLLELFGSLEWDRSYDHKVERSRG